jgi:hypothetical protein
MPKKNRDVRRVKASSLSAIEALVNAGKAVVSADNSIVIAMMQEAIRAGRTEMTFFVSPEQATAVMQWFLTPGRIKQMDVELVSKEERAKIKSELGVNIPAAASSRGRCSNGHVYGLFEFIQQGIREHGSDYVHATMELKNTAVLRINPVQLLICPKCSERFVIFHKDLYACYRDDGKLLYGCCKGEIPGPILA